MILLNALDSLIKNGEKTFWYDLACTQISSFLLALLMCFCLCDRSITHLVSLFCILSPLSSLSSLGSSCCCFTFLSFSWWNHDRHLSPDLGANKEIHLLSLRTGANRKQFTSIGTITHCRVVAECSTTVNMSWKVKKVPVVMRD